MPSILRPRPLTFPFFFFNDTATTEIYTLSLHDALPISSCGRQARHPWQQRGVQLYRLDQFLLARDRKSTRLNSSHDQISYAVFCLKKKDRKGLVGCLLDDQYRRSAGVYVSADSEDLIHN